MAAVWVRELVLQNFKSYDGRVSVGPFRKFTCVVGPNGAGKSNLVDAISFVLGVSKKRLRLKHLQDLVHKKENESVGEVSRITFVELVCEGPPEAFSLEGSIGGGGGGGGVRVVFRRTISPGAAGTVFQRVLPGGEEETLSEAEYSAHLARINILPEAQNCLVFQGDVEAAARRQGRELTRFLEKVSGSDAHRVEYDRLAAEKAKREENARYRYSQRRSANREKERVKEQKKEAEKYRRLDAERANLQTEFFLFRLHCVRWQLEANHAARADHDRERIAAEDAAETGLKQKLDAERERAAAHLEAAKAERGLAEGGSQLATVGPDEAEVAGRLRDLRKQLEDLRSGAERSARRRQQLQEQAEALEQEHAKTDAELAQVAADIAKQQPPFTPAQRKEFEQAQRKAERITADSADHVRFVEAKIKAISRERARAERERRELEAKRDHSRQRIEDLAEAEDEAATAEKAQSQTADERARQLERLRAAGLQQAEEKGKLMSEREGIMKEIQDITAIERQIKYEQKIAGVTKDLVQMVSGVHGRMVDLCKPAQDRLGVAVNVALGGYLYAVVTETSDGAKQCIRHLRERMQEPMTFLPLDRLRVQPLDRRVTELLRGRSTLRPALSCVTFNPRFARAFEFLLNDVVVADSLEEARSFFYDELQSKGLSCRVVTLHGETISRDGNMAISGDVGQDRFNFAAIGLKKTRLEEIDRRMHQIHAFETTAGANQAALQEDARRTEARASTSRQALAQCKQELETRRSDLEKVTEEIARLAEQAARLEQEEAQHRQEQRDLEQQIGEVVSVHFAQLSAAMGMEDVAKLERDLRHKREEGEARQRVLEQRKGSIGAEMDMVRQTLEERALRDPSKAIAKCEEEIRSLEDREGKQSESADAAKEHLKKLRADLSSLQEIERDKERAAAQAGQEAREAQQRLAEVSRQLAAVAAEAQELQQLRDDLMQQSVLENVRLPLRGDHASLEEDLGGRRDDPTRDLGDVLDFGALPPQKRAVREGPAVGMLEDEYRSELARLGQELDRLQPNMKAVDQLSALVEQAEGATQNAAQARSDIEEVDILLRDVAQRRTERFMDCWNIVKEQITMVYKRLTAGTAGVGSEGGSASLDLEDVQDPFLGGVMFTVMPPGKRFTDVALLSGGEKTLAAMALLFAVQAYQRPPFLVLDEIDAHLDNNNLQALARYVAQSECQTIVVSLKDKFFSHSEGLVGVSRSVSAETSVIFTADLDRFRHGQLVPAAGPGTGPGGAPKAPGSRPGIAAHQPRSPLPLAGAEPGEEDAGRAAGGR